MLCLKSTQQQKMGHVRTGTDTDTRTLFSKQQSAEQRDKDNWDWDWDKGHLRKKTNKRRTCLPAFFFEVF
jgi:hypothetical protein